MKKPLFGLVGLGILAACSQIVGGFSAFNLSAPKQACVLNTSSSVTELNLSFNYTGTLKGLKLTFTPNGKTGVVANIADLGTPPAGLRVNTLTAGEAKMFIDLNTLATAAASTQAVPKPDSQVIYPMDIKLEAIGSGGEKPGALNLLNVDVAKCYP